MSCITDNTCKNNSTCSVIDNQIKCECSQGYKGLFCQYNDEDLSKLVDSSVNKLNSFLNSTKLDSNAISAIDDLKISFDADPSLITAQLTNFLVGLSTNIDSKVVENKIDCTKQIFKIYDLGMKGVL